MLLNKIEIEIHNKDDYFDAKLDSRTDQIHEIINNINFVDLVKCKLKDQGIDLSDLQIVEFK